MKARINLKENHRGHGYYGVMDTEEQYEAVKEGRLKWEESKRVTHYLVPASVFPRLLKLDRVAMKLVGTWETYTDDLDISKVRCSCCQTDAEKNTAGYYILSKFCPECGADLRGENYETENN